MNVSSLPALALKSPSESALIASAKSCDARDVSAEDAEPAPVVSVASRGCRELGMATEDGARSGRGGVVDRCDGGDEGGAGAADMASADDSSVEVDGRGAHAVGNRSVSAG